jgi:UDPglucose 6-dehydrogenase
VTEANERQKNLVFQKIANYFRDLAGRRVAIWGLSFKPGTDDVRESPARILIQRLLDAGAFVVGHDPQGQSNFAKDFGEHERLTYSESAYDALRGADALGQGWPDDGKPRAV